MEWFRVPLLAPTVVGLLLDFWKICAPLSLNILTKQQCQEWGGGLHPTFCKFCSSNWDPKTEGATYTCM